MKLSTIKNTVFSILKKKDKEDKKSTNHDSNNNNNNHNNHNHNHSNNSPTTTTAPTSPTSPTTTTTLDTFNNQQQDKLKSPQSPISIHSSSSFHSSNSNMTDHSNNNLGNNLNVTTNFGNDVESSSRTSSSSQQTLLAMDDFNNSLTIQNGAKFLFLGNYESGKSTFCKTLFHFYKNSNIDVNFVNFTKNNNIVNSVVNNNNFTKKEYLLNYKYLILGQFLKTFCYFLKREKEIEIYTNGKTLQLPNKEGFLEFKNQLKEWLHDDKFLYRGFIENIFTNKEIINNLKIIYKNNLNLFYQMNCDFNFDYFYNFNFYLNDIDRLLPNLDTLQNLKLPNLEYIPTRKDILMERTRTSGIRESTLQFTNHHYNNHYNNLENNNLNNNLNNPNLENNKTIKIIEVGGARNERRKWKHCESDFIIYFISLIDFVKSSYEDNSINRLQESLEVFENNLLKNNNFIKNRIIIIFTHVDLFLNLLKFKINNLQNNFLLQNDFKGNLQNPKEVFNFILNKFKDIYFKYKNRDLEYHVLNLLNEKEVKDCFNCIMNGDSIKIISELLFLEDKMKEKYLIGECMKKKLDLYEFIDLNIILL